MNILNTGNFYVLKDDGSYEKIFDGEIKTIEFEPEPLDIMNLMPKNVFWNIKPMAMSMTAKFKPDFINDRIIQGKPVGPWTMTDEIKLQKRKHHKTRISKKWAKKYGYYTFEDTYEIKSFEPQDIDKEILSYDCKMVFKERKVYWN